MLETIIHQILHEAHVTESWIVTEDSRLNKKFKKTLIGVHLNLLDYFGNRPFLIVPLGQQQPCFGQVLRDVYLIEPVYVPSELDAICVNKKFIDTCVSELAQNIFEGIDAIFKSDQVTLNLHNLQQKENLIIAGVVRSRSEHWTRGIDEASTETHFAATH